MSKAEFKSIVNCSKELSVAIYNEGVNKGDTVFPDANVFWCESYQTKDSSSPYDKEVTPDINNLTVSCTRADCIFMKS